MADLLAWGWLGLLVVGLLGAYVRLSFTDPEHFKMLSATLATVALLMGVSVATAFALVQVGA